MSTIPGRLSKFFTRRRVSEVALIALVCVALAAFAQRSLDRQARDLRVYLLYGFAAVLFALTFGHVALERSSEPDASTLLGLRVKFLRSVSIAALLLAVALLGCLGFGGNRFRPLGLLLWGGGLCLCLCYLYLSDGPAHLAKVTEFMAGKSVRISRQWVFLAAAVVVGAVLRLRQLEVIPADIGWDLPYNFADVRAILRGEYRIFFPANLGREGMFFYLIALVSRFAPLSHFSLKLTSALVGIATIPALYVLARKLFNPSVALIAAFLLAVNRWHIVLTRSGFRVSLMPLFSILLLYTLVRALQSYKLFDFAFAGLVLGLGLFTYMAFLFGPVAVVVCLVVHLLTRRPVHWRVLLPLVALMIAVAIVAYAPLGRFALENPKAYFERTSLQVRLLKGDGERTPLDAGLLLENMRTSLLMFNVYGDGNSRFNVPFFRHFGFVSGVLLVLGCFYALRRWGKGYNSLLLTMFFVFILPSGLVALPRELPNIFRASGAIGPALVLAALPLAAVARALRELSLDWPAWDLRMRFKISSAEQAYDAVWQIGRRSLLVLLPLLAIVLLLVLEGRETTRFYFHDLANVLPDKQNVSVAKEMALQIEAYGDLSSSYIKVWPYWFDGRALLMYLRQESEREWNPYFYVSNLAADQPPLSTVGRQALFLLNPADQEGLNTLRSAFPRHAASSHLFPDGTPAFILLHVER